MTESNEFGNYGQPAPLNEPLVDKVRQFASGQLLLGKYEVMTLLGVGGMGKVYKVRQVYLNKAFALKVLDMQQAMGEMQLRRFQLEAKATNSLSHPNLVKVFDFGLLEAGEPYLVMDFVDGITLHDYLKKNGPLTPEHAVKVFIQAASGLAYAHQRNVIHRDIKPSNIMLDAVAKIGARESIKIVDFGIAKMAEGGEVQGLTRTGEVFGSPLYMSPEQCTGEIVDHRSDIYSLGCSLFEALTGTPPHVGNSALRTMMLHQTAPAPYLREASLGTNFPENLEMIVHKMLEKSPAERYQILEEVVDDLNNALSEVAITGKTQSTSVLPKFDSKKSAQISIKPANFALVIVTVMALSSASTIGIERLIQHYNPQKIELPTKQAADSKLRENVSLMPTDKEAKESEKSPFGVPPEVDKNDPEEEKKSISAAKKMEKFIADADPIKATHVEENGVEYEDLNFPDKYLGFVSNVSFVIPDKDVTPRLNVAEGKVRFPVSKRLLFALDRFSLPFQYPKLLNKIDPALFQELVIQPNRFLKGTPGAGSGDGENLMDGAFNGAAMSTTGSTDRKYLDEQMVKSLEAASSWTELDGIFISQLTLKSDAINALHNLKKLRYLRLMECDTDVHALIDASILRHLKYLSLTDIPCKEIIENICDSPNLESVSISGEKMSAELIRKLQKAPHLKDLDISTNSLDDEQMHAIESLKKIEILSIRDSSLTPPQLNELLKKCLALKKLQLNGRAYEHVNMHLVEDSRIEQLR